MSVAKKEALKSKRNARRFDFSRPLKCILRSEHSRYTCFWVECLNLSRNGMFVEFGRECFVPYKKEDLLRATIDLDCMFFPRPVHVMCQVKREQSSEDGLPKGLGIIFTDVEKEHRGLFENSLSEQEANFDPTDTVLRSGQIDT